MASRARATQFNSSTLGRLERKVGPERKLAWKLAKGAAVAGKRAAIVRRPMKSHREVDNTGRVCWS